MSSKPLKTLFKAVAAAATAASLLSGAHAAPVSFTLTNIAFVHGGSSSSYGSGSTNQLGVDFLAATGPVNFNTDFGVAAPFSVGSIRFNDSEPSKIKGTGKDKGKELDGPPEITKAETNKLELSASFTLQLADISQAFTVTSIVTAVEGPIGDAEADYSIDWIDFLFNDTKGLSFRVSLADQSFTNNSLNFFEQLATFTLLSAPAAVPNTGTPGTPGTELPGTSTPSTGTPVNDGGMATPSTPPNAVPEPDTLALAGLALGLGALTSRRRRQA
ncbi:PEP-CTERM sorting domain-containing protein [Azohydromonas aeria]|uniref:PEP-CTERM sorting domain-containing protein n=1 Tax=Azohydromonas aeria TaxID=2590212 RepID=UPI0018E01757|nr:PEP-CTERM sorting domain-containing protein [Azohydromonas aeria]